jgi:NADPH:quinone reductase
MQVLLIIGARDGGVNLGLLGGPREKLLAQPAMAPPSGKATPESKNCTPNPNGAKVRTHYFPRRMKAVAIAQPGPPEVLALTERPTPVPTATQVLVRVKAAGVNRADLIQREGKYPAPDGVPADIPGLEIAGMIERCGDTVRQWKPGGAVCALLAGGGYAEFVAVEAAHCLPVPANWTFVDAAALPEAVFTVWSNVFQRGALQPGERLLVHGGTSGIGMAAIQLAHAFGAHPIATAGSAEKCQACLAAGAERAINYRTEDFETALKDDGVDVILDMIGGDYVAKNLRLLRPEGRLVFINAMHGAKAEFNAHHIMSRRLTITGSTLRSRESAFKAALATDVQRNIWPVIEAGKFRPNVHATFALADAANAHRLMQSSAHIGKIVLTV